MHITGCCSWKHTKEEGEKARDKMPPKYRQYLVDDESDHNDDLPEEDDSKSSDTFQFYRYIVSRAACCVLVGE